MTYALIIDGAVQSVGRLPNSARRLDTQQWVMGLATAPEELVAACGYREVLDMRPQYDEATQVLERGDVFLSTPTTPVVAYTIRAKTPEELTADALSAAVTTNRQALTDIDDVKARIASIGAFLVDPDVQVALDQPNNTALTVAQQNRFNKAVARQHRRQANAWVALARLVVGGYHPELLEDIRDTLGEA